MSARYLAAAIATCACAAAAGCGADAPTTTTAQTTPRATAPADISVADIERANAAAHPRQAGPATATPSATVTPAPSVSPTAAVPKPPITPSYIPFPRTRKREMAAYAQRHYGIHTWRLRHPKVIVEHYTVTDDAASAIEIFRPDVADSELHELPGVCSHYVIDRDGTIDAVVRTSIMCRHTVGLNYTAIGIEHAGFSDQEILDNPAQMRASLALTRWLRCRYGIRIRNVIGHNESLSSPYHHENVPALRNQTHQDWTKADMDIYRQRLKASGPC